VLRGALVVRFQLILASASGYEEIRQARPGKAALRRFVSVSSNRDAFVCRVKCWVGLSLVFCVWEDSRQDKSRLRLVLTVPRRPWEARGDHEAVVLVFQVAGRDVDSS